MGKMRQRDLDGAGHGLRHKASTVRQLERRRYSCLKCGAVTPMRPRAIPKASFDGKVKGAKS